MVDMPAEAKKFYYPLEHFEADAERIARAVKSCGRTFTHIYGLPRGGLPLAVWLSHRLDLPLFESLNPDRVISKVYSCSTLIVDDIADTGKQLAKFRDQVWDMHLDFFIATLFYHRQSIVVPNVWLHEKKDEWIVFPWEKDPL